jgi:hypothetical protein
MSDMRDKALRRTGLTTRIRQSPEAILRHVRALYITVYNADTSIIPLSTELFHLLGSILEGEPPEKLCLHQIDRQTFLSTVADLAKEKTKEEGAECLNPTTILPTSPL